MNGATNASSSAGDAVPRCTNCERLSASPTRSSIDNPGVSTVAALTGLSRKYPIASSFSTNHVGHSFVVSATVASGPSSNVHCRPPSSFMQIGTLQLIGGKLEPSGP